MPITKSFGTGYPGIANAFLQEEIIFKKLHETQIFLVITNSDLNRPCFAWRPYGKSGLFKTELVIGLI